MRGEVRAFLCPDLFWKWVFLQRQRGAKGRAEGASRLSAGLGVFTVELLNKRLLTVLQMALKPLAICLKTPELELPEYLLPQ